MAVSVAPFTEQLLAAWLRKARSGAVVEHAFATVPMHSRTPSGNSPNIVLVQLPFPSQEDPLPLLAAYYAAHWREYQRVLPEYGVSDGNLWEAPLWIAHLDGAIGRDDTQFVDLSAAPWSVEWCVSAIKAAARPDSMLIFSPLAQNLHFAASVSRQLMDHGFRTVVGGNMVELASLDDFGTIYSGLARADYYELLLAHPRGRISVPSRLGRQQVPLGYRPRYRLLRGFQLRVPLIRLHASHGCLLSCTFCGDAWTNQLHVVDEHLLREEVAEVRATFPETRLVYIGDKTFGQSRQAVENLIRVLPPPSGFKLIVQTHVNLIDDWLLDVMEQLNVKVVEMGFETANQEVLQKLHKAGGADRFRPALARLKSRGFRPVLNILGGLPYETRQSQRDTLQFMAETRDLVWLYNLYNFVPYPKTPLFAVLRERIANWNFADWREDRPVVFEPFYQTRAEAWDHFLNLVALATSFAESKATSMHEVSA
jgi:Radical SAM superfamily